jgi:hypothetical protein
LLERPVRRLRRGKSGQHRAQLDKRAIDDGIAKRRR